MSHYNKGRLKEGANINKSLVTLGSVIQALGEQRGARQVGQTSTSCCQVLAENP